MSEEAPAATLLPAHGTGPLRGAVIGLAFGLAAGAVWFVVVIGTTAMTTYLVPAIGLAVAYGLHLGAHRPGRRAAILAVLVTAVATALSLYYVERHLVIESFLDHGDSVRIPLVPYFDWLGEVIGHAFGKGPAAPIYSALALAVAAWFGLHGFHPLHHGEHARREQEARA